MKPDREHLHNIFMRAGFSDHQVLIVITAVAILLASLGLAREYFRVPEWLMFAGFIGLFVLYDWSLNDVWRLLVILRKIAEQPH